MSRSLICRKAVLRRCLGGRAFAEWVEGSAPACRLGCAATAPLSSAPPCDQSRRGTSAPIWVRIRLAHGDRLVCHAMGAIGPTSERGRQIGACSNRRGGGLERLRNLTWAKEKGSHLSR